MDSAIVKVVCAVKVGPHYLARKHQNIIMRHPKGGPFPLICVVARAVHALAVVVGVAGDP